MLYTYDKNNLQFKKLDRKKALLLIGGIFALLAFSTSITPGPQTNKETITIVEHDTVYTQQFSEENLIRYMKELNIKYPHIVLAQARIESGTYTSAIFKENHNLFGMKRARVRVNTALCTQYGHAYYDSWRSSVFDYAFYQCRYLSSISSESEYFQYLSQSYAEDGGYVSKLKDMIERENLKSKF